MKKTKIGLLFLIGALMCSSIVGCGKTEDQTKDKVTGNKNSEETTVVMIDEIGVSTEVADEINESVSQWNVSRLFIDTAKEQYEENGMESLKPIIDYAEQEEATAYILLATKHEAGVLTYAYEATDNATGETVVMYVSVLEDGTTEVTLGPTSDEDEILLGVKSNKNEDKDKDTSSSSDADVSENGISKAADKVKDKVKEK